MLLKWKVELLFWILTAIVTFLIMLPIHNNFGIKYPYYTINYAFIIIFLTYTRYIFFLRYTPFSHTIWVKALLTLASIPLSLWAVDQFYEYLKMLDEVGLESLINTENIEKTWQIAKYTKYQFLFFGTSALLTIMIIPIRMIVSVWRVRNRKGIV